MKKPPHWVTQLKLGLGKWNRNIEIETDCTEPKPNGLIIAPFFFLYIEPNRNQILYPGMQNIHTKLNNLINFFINLNDSHLNESHDWDQNFAPYKVRMSLVEKFCIHI